MDNELEVIRTQMEHTRSSLADKLEALENEFRGTVEGATSAVANTVETVQETVSNVKETVQETVASVKETFNVRKHVQRHPWAMFSGAVMVGCFAGFMIGGRRKGSTSAREAVADVAPPQPTPIRNGAGHRNGASKRAAAKPAPSTEERGPLESSLQALKGLAIGTLMSTLRDILADAVPSNLAPDLVNVVDEMTTALGGKPLRRSETTNEPTTGTEGGTPHDESEAADLGRPMGNARWSG